MASTPNVCQEAVKRPPSWYPPAMNIFAIGDLHMPSRLGKHMDVFGAQWNGHVAKVARAWDDVVTEEDLVLVPGDTSWGMRLDEVVDDLGWLGERPGTKVLIRGNHDYWWQSITKVRAALPPSCHAIQNDAYVHPSGRVAVAGTRLWDVPDLRFGSVIDWGDAPPISEAPSEEEAAADAKIFEREMGRLDRSLRALPPGGALRIAMLHYPPTTPDLVESPVTRLLESHRVDVCVFGHLHSVRADVRFDGERNGIRYVLSSVDFIDFRPLLLLALDTGI